MTIKLVIKKLHHHNKAINFFLASKLWGHMQKSNNCHLFTCTEYLPENSKDVLCCQKSRQCSFWLLLWKQGASFLQPTAGTRRKKSLQKQFKEEYISAQWRLVFSSTSQQYVPNHIHVVLFCLPPLLPVIAPVVMLVFTIMKINTCLYKEEGQRLTVYPL